MLKLTITLTKGAGLKGTSFSVKYSKDKQTYQKAFLGFVGTHMRRSSLKSDPYMTGAIFQPLTI